MAQGLMYPWRAIGPPIPLVQLNDGAFECFIVLPVNTQWPGQPSVKAATRHTEEHAKPFDAELIPVLLDKRKNQ